MLDQIANLLEQVRTAPTNAMRQKRDSDESDYLIAFPIRAFYCRSPLINFLKPLRISAFKLYSLALFGASIRKR